MPYIPNQWSFAMKKISAVTLAALLAAAVGLAGCGSPAGSNADQGAPAAGIETQALSPMQKISGVYAGELPCADCSGIRTTLYLRANGVYTRISEYAGRVGEGQNGFEEGGRWTLDERGLIRMTPAAEGGTASLARAEEGAVRLLNADGEDVEGALADFYVLKKDQ